MPAEELENHMPEDTSNSLDILGVKPVGDAIKIATEETFKGAEAFLGRICLPAAEELGLLLRDRVGHWRSIQAAKIAEKGEAKVKKYARGNVHAHPRLVFLSIDKGSWSDDDAIQEAWSGILASSCTEDGKDDSNIVFAAILDQLTGVQLRILNYSVETCSKFTSPENLPYTERITIPFEELVKITGCRDMHRLDRELDHLRGLELIGGGTGSSGGGFVLPGNGKDLLARIHISALALHLYVRAQGFIGSPNEFFDLKTGPEYQVNQPVSVSEITLS